MPRTWLHPCTPTATVDATTVMVACDECGFEVSVPAQRPVGELVAALLVAQDEHDRS